MTKKSKKRAAATRAEREVREARMTAQCEELEREVDEWRDSQNELEDRLHRQIMENHNQLRELIGAFNSSLNARLSDQEASLHALRKALNSETELSETLETAAVAGSIQRVTSLLADGYDVNERFAHYGQTALYSAARAGHAHVVEVLLDAGAFIDAADDRGVTPLITACRCSHSDVAMLLIERGANVTLKTKEGNSALHYACRLGFANVVQALLANGANATERDSNYETPVECVESNIRLDMGSAEAVMHVLQEHIAAQDGEEEEDDDARLLRELTPPAR